MSNGTTKQRPYLLRAMHEWMVDNGLTPHIVVDAEAPGLRTPDGHARDGKLVLNVSYTATRNLSLGNDEIVFEARFDGVPQQVGVPVEAVLGVYARETGQGMVFADEDSTPPSGPTDGDGERRERPNLTVVK